MKIKFCTSLLLLVTFLFAQNPGSKMPSPQQQLLITAAQTAPIPTSIVVTVTVSGGTPHTYTYTVMGAEVTKNRLVLSNKIPVNYTSDQFAIAMLKILDDQAFADANNINTTTASQAAAIEVVTTSVANANVKFTAAAANARSVVQ